MSTLEYKQLDIVDHLRIAREEEPRFKQVEQLEGILRLISHCEARVNDEIALCKRVYGEVAGVPQGLDINQACINRFRAIRKRLKRYYNYKLSQLSKY